MFGQGSAARSLGVVVGRTFEPESLSSPVEEQLEFLLAWLLSVAGCVC